jgi:hypothetical protein
VVRQVASFRQRLDRHGHTRELMAVESRKQKGVKSSAVGTPLFSRPIRRLEPPFPSFLQGAREAVPGEVIEVVRQVASFRQRLDRHGHTRDFISAL